MSHHRRHRLVLAALAVLAIAYPVSMSDIPAFADCSQADRNAGECRSIDGSTSDNQVTIRVDTSTPGSSGSSGGSTSTGDGGGGSTTTEATNPSPPIRRGPPPPPRDPTLGSSNCEVVIGGMCRGTSPPRNQPSPTAPQPPGGGSTTPATPPAPPRSISELGEFSPERPGLTIQPGDWSMPRLPTNVIANARTHQQSGELAGWPIEVRFIPHRYHWNFGDGTHKTFSEAGRTWAALGLRQFQHTPTSHIYQRPGSYQLSVRVEYRAEFRFVGESWQRLSGTVSSTSQTSRLRVLTVSPLLLGD
jgi:hypothetical protein